MGIGTICVFMFMTIFNETHSLHIEYGIGAALFIILGMLFVSTGLMLAAIQKIKIKS